MERLWLARLRWRMRGAWLWPSFVAATLGEGVLLHELPPWGDGTRTVSGALLAGFANLFAVAAIAPLAARALRRRRSDLPKIVAQDYTGTALVGAIAVALLLAGLAHRPAIREQERDLRAQAAAVHAYVMSQAPARYRRNLAAADTWKIDDDLFRTCVPGPDPKRSLCLVVNTGQSPAGVRVDGNRAPNSAFARPDSGG